MLKLAGITYTAIRSLYEGPFFLEERQVERCIDLAIAVEKCILASAEEFAQQEGLGVKKAKAEILLGRASLPRFGKLVIPTVWDIAAQVRPWIIYVEDEDSDREEVKRLATTRKAEILIVREDSMFLHQIQRQSFLQYWVDLGLGPKGKTEIGKNLLNSKKFSECSATGEVVVITQHARAGFLNGMLESKQVRLVIDKGKSDSSERVVTLIDRGLKEVKERFGFWPNNPMLSQACEKTPWRT